MSTAQASLSKSSAEKANIKANINETQIAFMPDIHFHDIYADFKDGSFKGIPNSISGKNATIRSLSAELNSTRLFNENYFAMFSALDDAVSRGVKLIALPGDFSDDGQPVHMRGLTKILDNYAKEHDIEFFAAPGNHDPVRPFKIPSGKSDFLGAGGKEQRIFSRGKNECKGYDGAKAVIKAAVIKNSGIKTDVKTNAALDTICSEEVSGLGYQGIMQQLKSHGFYPKPNYHYWETPYSSYNSHNYDYQTAQTESVNEQREYEICHQGAGGKYKQLNANKNKTYTNCFNVIDSSYLVEPIKGLWLLAIDANVYVPNFDATEIKGATDVTDPNTFKGSSSAGYNKMFTHKTQVIEWISDVVKRAKKEGKQLVAFSHFPMTEFYDGQEDNVKKLFDENKFQRPRLPKKSVSQALASTGLKVHIGGHMHINDTGVTRNNDGSFLFNIQAPSIAAYIPAYKLMTLKANEQIEIQTVVVDDIPRYSELFEHYRQEHKVLQETDPKRLWNIDILASKSYKEFTQWHIRELTRQRFLPKDWPADLRNLLFSLNGLDMLVLSQLNTDVTIKQWQEGLVSLDYLHKTPQWTTALVKAKKLVLGTGLQTEQFSKWNGFDLAVDFYRLHNADQLALRDISQQRLAQYSVLTKALANSTLETRLKTTNELVNTNKAESNSSLAESNSDLTEQTLTSVFKRRFGNLFRLFDGFKNGAPSDHFMLNLSDGTITDLKK
ncbi:metallophosphoesterase [Psychrosphaera saromensis]|uniref:Phosphoesterase n=2 Tax=Psychrosphaera saromensis TaxID=716813 RepID=A0A2S7UZY6_9GAMM|nr:phosphoesterase [Psychrosphaera saromensis]GHB76124.1 metallophosphoesterase [Psychrosphaera saromensis]GLQ14499.1 metallophosphoesterase [Psychrosphaera saromensis]